MGQLTMHLRSITLKGFKSFPDRTKLDFTPGVSVIVGPNGSGKSNVTDAVLWALGEQSPLAVRGQTMQDVIFAGGHGLPSRGAAEVEVVIDNADGAIASEFSEISVMRRLERSGEGEYRLNGARCRLVDVIEALSDTGLGKEMHSVVSQGRVEGIIHSKPRDRRLLIEEAAGLGKHRKRRRRAELKLERTAANLARALDVEREARSRLRPLKRQAEAAALHERLERQSLEAELALAQDRFAATSRELELRAAEAVAARAEREQAERLLAQVAARRERAEEAFRRHGAERERRSGALHAARSAAERIAMRCERVEDVARLCAERSGRLAVELEALQQSARGPQPEAPANERMAVLEGELESLTRERDRLVEEQLAELALERDAVRSAQAKAEAAVADRVSGLAEAERRAEAARSERSVALRAVERSRQAASATGAELAIVNDFLRSAAAAPGGARSLAGELGVEPGYEQALAAALGSLLRAGIVSDVTGAHELLDAAAVDGGSALVERLLDGQPTRPTRPPTPAAVAMVSLVRPQRSIAKLAERLLADAWVVDSLDNLDPGFTGIAATRTGRVLFAATGELRQSPATGERRILEQQNHRDELLLASERAVGEELEAAALVERAEEAVSAAYGEREEAESALREARRALDLAGEELRRIDWLIERRAESPDESPQAVRAAALLAELRAERRLAEQLQREHAERLRRIAWLTSRRERDEHLGVLATQAVAALTGAREAVLAHLNSLTVEVAADQALADQTAAELRSCAREEADLQRRLSGAHELVTAAEVRAQRLRDATSEAEGQVASIAGRLGIAVELSAEATISDAERADLTARLERLGRRRSQLGPVNPLAGHEYEEAVTHVEELEAQRGDLESALSELEGLIRDTDRRIRESFNQTFDAAARNFEETVAHLFPGGRGRLRLVHADSPRPVLGGESADAADSEEGRVPDGEPGVEIEVTPAGKATKRLSLMSGGEKSLVALAFLFAVFLARPCPFYILDEVEAALDDANIDRFLQLVRRFCDRAQFIIVTHQKRTMDAADCLYGVSMGGNGVSKVISRKLGRAGGFDELAAESAAEAA